VVGHLVCEYYVLVITEPTSSIPFRRRRRIITTFVYSSLLIWFAYIAVSRWHSVPADTSLAFVYDVPPEALLDPALDRTAQLLAALKGIPSGLFWTVPNVGPEYTGWPAEGPIKPEEAVRGPWTPETLIHLSGDIDLLATPAVQEALTRLAAIEPGVCVLTRESRPQMEDAQNLLWARAKYHHGGLHDIDAACDDLELLVRLAALCMTSPNWSGLACGSGAETKAEAEISRMVFENHLTRAQASRLITALKSNLPDDRALWQCYVNALTSEYLIVLERSYTVDNTDNGWLVLSWTDLLMGDPSTNQPRLGLWNCFSPLFNSRRTVAAKIAWVRRQLEAADKLSSPDAMQELARLERNVPFNVLDGPLFRWFASTSYSGERELFAKQIAFRRATIAAIALSAYRREHGEYPVSLHMLVGAYLDAVPLDPCSGAPLQYFRKPGKDDYVVYSVRMDLVDDGGRWSRSDGTGTKDILFWPYR
jgi:hypothetical protein